MQWVVTRFTGQCNVCLYSLECIFHVESTYDKDKFYLESQKKSVKICTCHLHLTPAWRKTGICDIS